MKNKKKLIILISASLIPVLIVIIYLLYKEITNPGYFANGENLLLADMSSQYNSLYSYIQDVFLGNESIFYSFSKGLGGNMASTIGYYLSSPFNILYIFVSKASIPLCTFIIYLLKIGLTGLFMMIFLIKRFKNSKISYLIFSTFYALSAYTVNYYFNSMWLDVVMLAPLVLYGINYIIEKKKIYLYTIFLSLAIISNFYIAFMLCMFCVMYLIFEIITRFRLKKDLSEIRIICTKFLIGSLLAGGISCILILPALTNLRQILRHPLTPEQLRYDIRGLKNTIFNDFFAKLYIGSHSRESSLSRNRPNIYFGIISFVLYFHYFFNKNIKLKEKIVSFIITAIFIISFYLPTLNILWHGYSLPNGYICRFSYLFIFFIIFIACRNFVKLNKIKIIPSIIFVAVYILIANYISKQYLVFLEKNDIIISCIFVVTYTILLIILSRVTRGKKIITILLLLLSLTEVYINFSNSLITNKDMKIISSYNTYYNDICYQLNNLDENEYRVDGNYYYSYLDSMVCNYKSITNSLSTNDGKLNKVLYDYGLPLTYTTVQFDINKLPVMESILGIKYEYSKDEFEDTYYDFLKVIDTKKYNYVYKEWRDKKVYLYENPYALDLGFLIKDNKNKNFKEKNKLEQINSLMKLLAGNNKDILIPVKQEYLGNNNYRFNIDKNTDYLYLSYDYPISINWTSYESIYINNEYIITGTSDDIGIIKIPNKYYGKEIHLRIGYDNFSNEYNEINSLFMYYFDFEQFKEDINLIKKNSMEKLKINKNTLEGKVEVTDEYNTLFLSVPYDKGWNIYVDGKKSKYFKIGNGFTGIKLSKGKHTIKMKYISPNFKLGIVISLISIIILILYEKHNKKKI